MKKAVLVLLTAVMFAQSPPTTKLPEVPVEYRSKFQSLVIQQKTLQLDEMRLQEQFRRDVTELEKVNIEGSKLEKEMFKGLGLDPSKYTTQTNSEGEVVIVVHEGKK